MELAYAHVSTYLIFDSIGLVPLSILELLISNRLPNTVLLLQSIR